MHVLLTGMAAVTTTLTSCGGTSRPTSSRSAMEILSAARSAAQHASSVHVTGMFAQGRLVRRLDAAVVRGVGGTEEVQIAHSRIKLIDIGGAVYLKGLRGAPANSWVKTRDTATARSIATNVDQSKLLSGLLGSGGTAAKGSTTSVDGRRVIALRESPRPLYTAVLYVSAEGTPYPIALVKRGVEHGEMRFSNWNQPLALSPPAHAVEMKSQRPSG
jgi:hypothetical protein